MPLYISTKDYTDGCSCFERLPRAKGVPKLLQIINKRYAANSEAFRSRAPVSVGGPEQRLLYVTQREMAVVLPDDPVITHVGSDDATTCHIMLLSNPATCLTLITHLDDSDTPLQVSNALDRFTSAAGSLSEDDCLDCYLVGGYEDERSLSLQVTVDALHSLDLASFTIRLRLACVTKLNTEYRQQNVAWPVVYGLAATVGEGARDNFDVFPATFADKGPDLGLRSARHFSGRRTLMDVYDSSRHWLSIPPFHYGSIVDAQRLANQSDQWIRQHMSTSPAVEPADFASTVRRCLLFVAEHPDSQLVFNDRPRLYELHPTNACWTARPPEQADDE